MITGPLLAGDGALAGSVGVLLKQRGAVAVPVVLARHPLRSAIDLFASKWWRHCSQAKSRSRSATPLARRLNPFARNDQDPA